MLSLVHRQGLPQHFSSVARLSQGLERCVAPAMGSSTSRPSRTTSTIVPLPDGASASGSVTVTCGSSEKRPL
jgi:hypothetical protein